MSDVFSAKIVDEVRSLFGAIVIGFIILIILVVSLAVVSPDRLLPKLMFNGGYVWLFIAIVVYPFIRTRRRRRKVSSR